MEYEGRTLHPRLILKQNGLTPKKSLGQNFLSDDNILADIAACSNLTRADQVLEIGPGLGALTRHLAHSAGEVIAIELDQRLIPILEEIMAGRDNVRIVQGDILEMDPEKFFRSGYKVVANVPYYITGAILRHLLTSNPRPEQMTLTVQQEVASRLTALPGKMSIMAVTAQYYGQIRDVFTIKAGSFWPRPDVDSSVVSILLREKYPLEPGEEDGLFRVVKVGFSQKRKQLQKNLRAIIDSRQQVDLVLEMAEINGARRAETLCVEEWIALYKAIKSS